MAVIPDTPQSDATIPTEQCGQAWQGRSGHHCDLPKGHPGMHECHCGTGDAFRWPEDANPLARALGIETRHNTLTGMHSVTLIFAEDAHAEAAHEHVHQIALLYGARTATDTKRGN